MRSIGIIGGGITGLTAAHHLRKAGFSVTLYEASPRTGGVICSHRDGECLAEGGPNTILETAPEIAALVEELGLAPRRHYSSPDASARYVVRNAAAVQLPASPIQFFLAPFFSWNAKFSLLCEPFRPRRRETTEESVAEFVQRRLGREFLEYGIDPLVTGIYAGDPAQLSVEHAFPRIHALEARYGSLIRGQFFGARERKKRGDVAKDRARKFSFDDGLQVLPDTLAQRNADSLQLHTRVTRATRTGTSWTLHLERTPGTGSRPVQAQHDVVLFCGTAHSLARLELDAPDVPSLAPLAEVHCPPVTSVVLGFRRSEVSHPCSGFGVLIPHR
ncbi:MAG: protoporphyrinogen oxidase, partial [Verrucomicrobiales bacterium]|nr:protoporphyrinogen oxidase [Verrucomicrobiales bacterium]